MAKVYEALQRAEEERRRKAGGPPSDGVAPLVWEEESRGEPSGGRASVLGRLLRRAVGRGPSADTVPELNKRRISILQPESYVAEQFRTLRGRLDSLAIQRPLRSVAVASANPGEGKSTAAVNLAIVTAMSVGRRVLLVDCDMRCPKIHRSLGLLPGKGLAEILLDEASLDESLLKVEGLGLDVLGVRNLPPNPSELLASSRMRSLMDEITARYDRAIVDTPACLGLPDSKTISELCDGVVMVVRADVTPRTDLEAALEILDRRRVLGLVLNGTEVDRRGYGYY